MSIFKSKTFSKKEKAESYLRYLEDREAISSEYKNIVRGLRNSSVFLYITIAFLFFFSDAKDTSPELLVFLAFVAGMITVMKISTENMLNTLISVSEYFDKEKLIETINNESSL